MIYRISQLIFEFFIRILFKISFSGRENIPQSPYLIVSNHTSLLDPPLIGIAFRRAGINFMAKKELFDMPIIGAWSRAVQCICTDRGRNSIKGLREVLRRVGRGRVVCIFPEGTRSIDGNLQNAERGVGFLIAKAGVPIVPVYIDGSMKALPRAGGINFRARVKVYVGKPVLFEKSLPDTGFAKKDYEIVANRVMKYIAQLKTVASCCKKR